MAVTYGFYDSLNHDRLYNAQQMSAIFDGIINDGVFMSVGNQFHTVAGTGMQVIVKSGRAWFDSTWTLNDAEYPLSIDAADVLLTRIDAVVLEVNSEVATRANTVKVVKGTPASTPAKPTLTNTATVHQHALAYVTVAKNITAITNSMIEIVVGKTETPYVTAILQTTDITDLFKKWENDFQVWFETVKGTLDGDVALNLQNQIDHCVKKADKATSADIEAGTVDKWVDANTFHTKLNPYRGLGTFVFSPIDYGLEKASNSAYLWCDGRYLNKEAYSSEVYNKLFLNPYMSFRNNIRKEYSWTDGTWSIVPICVDGYSYIHVYDVTSSQIKYFYVDLRTGNARDGTIVHSLNSHDRLWFSFFNYPNIYIVYEGSYSSYPNDTSSVLVYNITTNTSSSLSLNKSLTSSYLQYTFCYRLSESVIRFFFGYFTNTQSSAPDSQVGKMGIIDYNMATNSIAADEYDTGFGITNHFVLNGNLYMHTSHKSSNNYNEYTCYKCSILTPGSLTRITSGPIYVLLNNNRNSFSSRKIDVRSCSYKPSIDYTYVAIDYGTKYAKVYSETKSYDEVEFFKTSDNSTSFSSSDERPMSFIDINDSTVAIADKGGLYYNKSTIPPAKLSSPGGSFYTSVDKVLPIIVSYTNNTSSKYTTINIFSLYNKITLPVYNGYVKVK